MASRKIITVYFNINGRILSGLLFLVLMLFSASGNAQCTSFARAIARPDLAPYLHDGNYNATILGEGETIVLRKTFFEGQKYRLVVKGVPDLPDIRYRLIDESGGKTLFDNASHDFSSTWDFDVQATRTLSLEVIVLEDEAPETSVGGCVAILFGILRE